MKENVDLKNKTNIVMDKQKFINLLNDELEELERETKLTSVRFELYKKTNASEEDIKDAVHKSFVAERKLENLKKLINVPIIARIESASYMEVEDYRQSQVNLVESFITHYNEYLEIGKTKIIGKKKEREELIKLYSNTDESNEKSLRRELEAKVWRIQNELDDIESRVESYKRKIELGKIELEDIKNKSIKDIKIEQILKITDEKNIKIKHLFDNRPKVTKAMRLLYSVSDDAKKSKEMMKLLDEYNKLSAKKNNVAVKIHSPKNLSLPNDFWDGVNQKWWDTINNDRDNIIIHDADSFLKYVQKVIDDFDKELEFFKKHFTKEKLEDLPKYRHMDTSWKRNEWVNNLDKAMEFLEIHSGKISKTAFDKVKKKVEEYNKLKKKFFKTKKIREEQQSLIQEISNCYNSFVNVIFYWYCNEGNKVIDILGVDFEFSYRGLIASICNGDMEEIAYDHERTLSCLKVDLQRAAEKIKEKKNSFEPRMKELEKKMIELAGPEFKGTDFTPIAKNYKNYTGARTLTNIAVKIQEEELYKKIYDAVKEDVIKTESELISRIDKETEEYSHKERTNIAHGTAHTGSTVLKLIR